MWQQERQILKVHVAVALHVAVGKRCAARLPEMGEEVGQILKVEVAGSFEVADARKCDFDVPEAAYQLVAPADISTAPAPV